MARGQLDTIEITKLAEHGAADGMYNLGLMYSIGKDVEINLITAHKWFNLAAMRGNLEARKYRAELAAEMNPVEVAEAQRQAREWLATH